jgi:hypothetical protein
MASDSAHRITRVAVAALTGLGSLLLLIILYRALEQALSDATVPVVLIAMLLLTLVSFLAPRRR